MLFLNSKRLYEQKRYLHQPLNSCNGCNYPRKKLFNGTNYGSYRTQICLVSCSISTCFIKRKTSYGRHYHKFCSWRATISTILNNATAQYFPLQLMPPTQNSSSSTSLVQMRANTHVSSSVTDVVDILDVNYDDLFCDLTLLQQLMPSQTPEQFSKLPCSTQYHYKFEHNNQQVKVC